MALSDLLGPGGPPMGGGGSGGPPPQLQLGGDPSGPGGPPGAGPGDGQSTPGAPDTPQVTALVDHAATALSQALDQEKDPEDKALLADMIAKLHKFLGQQQSLIDTVGGAGPPAKLLRKFGSGGAPGPGL